jgi:iron complex outermembrane receptor protein
MLLTLATFLANQAVARAQSNPPAATTAPPEAAARTNDAGLSVPDAGTNTAPPTGAAPSESSSPQAAPPPAAPPSAAPDGGIEPPTSAVDTEPPSEPKQLEAVVVQEKALSPSDEAADELHDVTGGTNLIRSSDLKKKRVGTIGDVLNFQPGIYAQTVNGGEATRLSIRGSGLVRSGFLFGWGTVMLLDGQRMYGASGFPYEAVEPLALDHVEVLRGANAFEYGPLSLGGTINYVSKTGYTASPLEVRLEAGSYGYFHEQVSTGAVSGPFDYYLSLTRFDKQGYRDNTDSYSTRLVGNVGYQLTPKVRTRLFVRDVEQFQEDAGFLTRSQLRANPRQSQFGTQIRDRVNPGSQVIGDTTTFDLDHGQQLELGGQFDNSPINSPRNGPTSVYFVFRQLAGSLRYKREDKILGHPSDTLVSVIGHETLDNSWNSVIVATGQVAALRPAEQNDYTFLATNDTELVDRLSLDLGVAGVFQRRRTGVSQGLNLAGQYILREYKNVAPKAGLRYDLTSRTNLFANVSRSIDTPSANSFIRTDVTYVPQQFLNLNEATANTIEVGTRGQESVFAWNLSFYRSWVQNELLTVQIGPGVTTSSNATPTIHQGLEVGLDAQLWKSGRTSEGAPQQQLVVRQSYTWNNFFFQNDPTFHTNALAGVPIHLYQAELAYEHSAGFYAGVNTEASFADYAADFANTIFNKKYAIVGARIGFQQPVRGLQAFVEVRNLLNTTYAPVVSPIYNAMGVDSNVFAPGEGRAINVGVSGRL